MRCAMALAAADAGKVWWRFEARVTQLALRMPASHFERHAHLLAEKAAGRLPHYAGW